MAASWSADSKTAVWQFQQSATINQCRIVIGEAHSGQLDINVSPSNQTLPIRIGWLGLTAIVSGRTVSFVSGCIASAVGYIISGCNSGAGSGVSAPKEKNVMLAGSDSAAGPVMGTRSKESESEMLIACCRSVGGIVHCFNYRWSAVPTACILSFYALVDLNYLSHFPRPVVVQR